MATRKSPDDGRRRANIHVCCVCVCPGHVCVRVCVLCVCCVVLSCWLVLLACRVGLSCWLVRCCLVVLACLWLCFGLPAMSGPGPRAKLPNGPQRPRGPKHQLSRVSRSPPPRVRLFTHRKPSSADHLPAALTTRCRYDPHACGGRDTGPSLLPTTGRESQS